MSDPRGPFQTVAAAFHSCQGTFVRFAECGHIGEFTYNPTSLRPGARCHCFKCTLSGEELITATAAAEQRMAAAEPWPGSERFAVGNAA